VNLYSASTPKNQPPWLPIIN